VEQLRDNQRVREWTREPILVERLQSLSATTAPVTGFPFGPSVGLCEAVGHWNNADVIVQVPQSWTAVELALFGKTGNIEVPLDNRLVGDMAKRFQPGGFGVGSLSGVALSSRGRSFDRYMVRAYKTGVAHAVGFFHLRCWGSSDTDTDDLSGRPVSDLFGAPEEDLSYTSPAVGEAAATTIIFPAVPGSRIGITGLSWTTQAAVARTLFLETLRPPAPLGIARARFTYRAGATGLVRDSWAPPIWAEDGEQWQITLSGAAAIHYVNVQGVLR
jgi:hypothetical protein